MSAETRASTEIPRPSFETLQAFEKKVAIDRKILVILVRNNIIWQRGPGAEKAENIEADLMLELIWNGLLPLFSHQAEKMNCVAYHALMGSSFPEHARNSFPDYPGNISIGRLLEKLILWCTESRDISVARVIEKAKELLAV